MAASERALNLDRAAYVATQGARVAWYSAHYALARSLSGPITPRSEPSFKPKSRAGDGKAIRDEFLRLFARDRVNIEAGLYPAPEQRLFIYNSGDGYDAARLLLSDVLSGWARDLPGQLVIGIPNRDFLIAFSDVNPEILRAVAAQVQADAVQQQYGLTEQLFTLENGIVKEYSWE